jgi:hypothetical protein
MAASPARLGEGRIGGGPRFAVPWTLVPRVTCAAVATVIARPTQDPPPRKVTD